jgi:hypothetical protein
LKPEVGRDWIDCVRANSLEIVASAKPLSYGAERIEAKSIVNVLCFDFGKDRNAGDIRALERLLGYAPSPE